MTNYLKARITDVLHLNPHDFSENILKAIIEEEYQEALENTIQYVGKEYKNEDIIISKEENNRLYELSNLRDTFNNEFSELFKHK
jgi:hypothetical protein